MGEVQVLIIGSGFGGQCAAIRLAQAGIDDVRLLERRSFPGGTWCQNTYPGAAVDVQSPLYSMSFEPYPWTQMFAEQAELRQYTNHILDKYGLRDKITLDAAVTGVRWDEDAQRWEVTTATKGTFRARFLINASGPLSNPSIPAFPGRERFRGASFHTNAWDHGVDLRGKRVAVIGSGASAAQVIPAIAPDVAHLHVFQRTPHWVVPRHDRVFSPVERRLLRHKLPYAALRGAIYSALELRVIGFKYSKTLLDRYGQQRALRFLEQQVPDPVLRRRLTPDFTLGCKRVIVSSTLYPALQRDNVTLHTREQGVAEILEDGIRTTEGQTIPLDAIVYATGYNATDGALPFPVAGRDRRSLGDVWHEFPRAYLGTTVPGFPNLFLVMGPNTGIGHTSALVIIEAQMNYIAGSIAKVLAQGASTIEVTPEAEADYTAWVHAEMDKTVWKQGGCKSWYQSRSGHVIAMFPGFSFTFQRWTSRVRPDHHTLA